MGTIIKGNSPASRKRADMAGLCPEKERKNVDFFRNCG
jgi:hypothetical protein